MYLRNTNHCQKVELPSYTCSICRSNHLAARTTPNSTKATVIDRPLPLVKTISTWKGSGTLCIQCQNFYASETRAPDSWFFSGDGIGPGTPFACVDTRDEYDRLIRRSKCSSLKWSTTNCLAASWLQFEVAHNRIDGDNQVVQQSQIVSIIIRYDRLIGLCQVWVFDIPSSLAKLLIDDSIARSLKEDDPTRIWAVDTLHVVVAEAIVKIHRRAERDYRDRYRRIDKNQLRDPLVIANSTRDALSVSDILQASIDLSNSIKESYNAHDQLWHHDLDDGRTRHAYMGRRKNLEAKLDETLSSLTALLIGSRSNEHRVNLELQIAMLEANYAIALTNRQDAEAMKTMAILGIVFLPATFIAALFSMSFFSTDDDGTWRMSSKFWIYWVVTIPVTTLAGLTMWRWRFVKSKGSELRRLLQPYDKSPQWRRLGKSSV